MSEAVYWSISHSVPCAKVQTRGRLSPLQHIFRPPVSPCDHPTTQTCQEHAADCGSVSASQCICPQLHATTESTLPAHQDVQNLQTPAIDWANSLWKYGNFSSLKRALSLAGLALVVCFALLQRTSRSEAAIAHEQASINCNHKFATDWPHDFLSSFFRLTSALLLLVTRHRPQTVDWRSV